MTNRAALGAVAAVFAVSRLLVYAAGVRFDASPLTWYWQFIDPVLLRERLLESLFYSHAQPPLFNLLLGVTLKAFPASYTAALHVQFVIIGWLAAAGLLALLLALRVPVRASAVLTALFIVSPAVLLYENWLFYEYLAMALLVWAAVALHRFVSRATVASGTAFFVLVAALICTRSIFQIVWLAPIVIALMFVVRPRLVLGCAAAPLLAVMLLYAKNAALFGVPTTSAWLGMNLARGTVSMLDAGVRADLVAAGTLGPVSLIEPFSPPETYSAVIAAPPPRGVPVLDQLVKANGEPNFHAAAVAAVSRAYLRDALRVIRARPDVYGLAVRGATMQFFNPATDYPPVELNRRKIRTYEEAVNRWVYFRTPHLRRLGIGILAAYVFAGVGACLLLAGIVRARRAPTAEDAALLFIAYTCVYVGAVSTLTELGENHRMRFVLDPLVYAGVAAAIASWRRRRAV